VLERISGGEPGAAFRLSLARVVFGDKTLDGVEDAAQLDEGAPNGVGKSAAEAATV
jgi:hypothetical protein